MSLLSTIRSAWRTKKNSAEGREAGEIQQQQKEEKLKKHNKVWRMKPGYVEKEIRESSSQDIWHTVMRLASIDDGSVGTSNPEEMMCCLETIGETLESLPDLKEEMKSDGDITSGAAHWRRVIISDLFDYWFQNGTTPQEVSHVFSRILAFEWFYPNTAISVLETIPGYMFMKRGENSNVQYVIETIMRGLECLPERGNDPRRAALGMYVQFIREHNDGDGESIAELRGIIDVALKMKVSDIAHTIDHFLGVVSTELPVFLQEVAAYCAQTGTGGDDFQYWREIVAEAAPPRGVLWDAQGKGHFYAYIRVLAVMLKLPEFQGNQAMTTMCEIVTGLLQSLRRPGASRESYKYLDDEWDRLHEMLKVVEGPSCGWNEMEQINFM